MVSWLSSSICCRYLGLCLQGRVLVKLLAVRSLVIDEAALLVIGKLNARSLTGERFDSFELI